MNPASLKFALVLLAPMLAASPAFAAGALTGFPFTDESLAYTIKLPTGQSLGGAHVRATHGPDGWAFALTADASVPGFGINDSYTSHANADFCSMDFARQFVHGSHKGGEKETIDRSQETVERITTTNGGGKSQFSIPDCVKDALTLLFYARREMGQGRVPSAQQMLLGGLYDARMDYTGAETIQSGGKPVETDKVSCTIKGPASSVQFDIWFARDPARTPLLFRVPLSMGKVSMELAR